MQKKTAETFDAFQSKYSDAVNNSISFTGLNVDFFTRVKARYLLQLAREHFGDLSSIKALDVGCGVGNFHSLLAPAFGKLSGVDVSAASIDKASTLHPYVDYKAYDGSRLPYEDASIDLAFTICVMHHVPPENWPAFTKEMHRVIRPGGLALVFEHNPRNPLTMKAVNNCPFDEDAVLLKSHETVKLFNDAGFKEVDDRFIISIPPASNFLMKVDRLFSKIPYGAQYYVVAKRD